jgi:hypothetical protein
MGLFVVSRLAKRHGLTASLRRNEQNGTTASVLLPHSVLSELSRPQVATPGEASREESAAGLGRSTTQATHEHQDVDAVHARINSALGRPVRQPGAATESPAALAPAEALPKRTPAPVTPDPSRPDPSRPDPSRPGPSRPRPWRRRCPWPPHPR